MLYNAVQGASGHDCVMLMRFSSEHTVTYHLSLHRKASGHIYRSGRAAAVLGFYLPHWATALTVNVLSGTTVDLALHIVGHLCEKPLVLIDGRPLQPHDLRHLLDHRRSHAPLLQLILVQALAHQ